MSLFYKAAEWLVTQPWFIDMNVSPDLSYDKDRAVWKRIADAVRQQGFYSRKTSTMDLPVRTIVRAAIRIRNTSEPAA